MCLTCEAAGLLHAASQTPMQCYILWAQQQIARAANRAREVAGTK